MKYACAIVLLGLLVGCSGESPQNDTGDSLPTPAIKDEPRAKAEMRVESKTITLTYTSPLVASHEKVTERLDKMLEEGWRAVCAYTASSDTALGSREYRRVVVILEREVPAN